MFKTNKRYLGMTGSQVGILIGAGVLALLTACGAIVFIFMSQPGSTAAPIVTSGSSPTPAALPTDTIDFATAVATAPALQALLHSCAEHPHRSNPIRTLEWARVRSRSYSGGIGL